MANKLLYLVPKLHTMSTLRLLRNLHTMSLAKAVPASLKDCKYKTIALCKCPPTPHAPKKDCVQEMVSVFKHNHLKTQIGKGTEIQVPIWHSSMHVAFLIPLGSALEVIKRKGIFKVYVESKEVSTEQRGRIKQVKDQLAELDDSTTREARTSRKSNKTSNVATNEASPTDPALRANLTCLKSNRPKKPWTRPRQRESRLLQTCSSSTQTFCQSIPQDQTASDPYTDLQGCSKK
jgi:hypothetical protein